MIKVLIGDLFASKAQAKVNAVNSVGVMGKGVALAFKQRFPEMFEDYAGRCRQKQVRLGEPYVYRDKSGTVIINFPTKDHWKSSSKLADIERGLDHFAKHYAEWGIKSVAFPALGCGLGGLTWAEVGPVMFAKLQPLDLDVEVYAPFGTPKEQVESEFLSGGRG